MHYEVVTIGSSAVDYFADTDSELIGIDTRHSHQEFIAFPLGSKILINEMNVTTGGGGTNCGACFSRMGFTTGYLGKLGDDSLADFILAALKRDNIDFLGAREGITGVSFVLNSIRQDRTILTYKGANNFLLPADIQPFETDWIYLSSMLETSWETVSRFVAGSSASLAFNPSSYQAAMGYDKLREVIERSTVMIMNREEAAIIQGLDPAAKTDTRTLLDGLARIPDQTVVITDAANGVWLKHRDSTLQALPVPDLEILETTGAGDAFAATFTGALIRGMNLQESIRVAMTNAESVLQHRGAKERLLPWDELLRTDKLANRQVITHAP
jgi:ribokinase